MNNLRKKNLLSMLCVFSFVAFCFAVSNTFGGTYAYTEVTERVCPEGYVVVENFCARNGLSCPNGGVYDSFGSELCWLNADSNGSCPAGYTKTAAGTGPNGELCHANLPTTATCNADETLYNDIWCKIDTPYETITKYKLTATLDPLNGEIIGSNTRTCVANSLSEGCSVVVGTASITGKDFIGWDTSAECSNPNAGYNGYIRIYDDTKFYACYEGKETPTFNVSFDLKGGQLVSGSSSASCECTNCVDTNPDNDYCIITVQKMPTVQYDGYDFRGWSTNESCSSLSSGTVKATKDNQTFYACWNELSEDEGNEYAAELDANGGWVDKDNGYTLEEISCETSSSTETSCIVDEFTTPTRDGFIFKGYGEATSCTSGIYEFELSASNNGKTYYACWVEDNSSGSSSGGAETGYNVTFELDGGKLLVNGNVSNDYEVRLSEIDASDYIASKANHTFLGWSKSANSCTNTILDETIKFTEDTTLYACFDKIEEDGGVKYKVVFNSGAGLLYVDNKLSNKKIYELDKIDYSDYTAKREGFVFKGWRTSTGTCKDAKIAKSETLTKDLNLVACYEAIESDISDNPNTGSSLLYVVYLIGILALCYTGYYAYNYSKNRK